MGTPYRLSTSKAIDYLYNGPVFDASRRPHRPAARHPRHADPPDAAVGRAAWLRDRAGHPCRVVRGPAGRSRLALSRAPAARQERVGHREVGPDRREPAGEVLPPHARGKKTAPARGLALDRARERDQPGDETCRRARFSGVAHGVVVTVDATPSR